MPAEKPTEVQQQAAPGWPAAELEHYKPGVLVHCDALFLRADLEGEPA